MKIMTLKMLGLLGITFVGLYGAQEGPVYGPFLQPDMTMMYARNVKNPSFSFQRDYFDNDHTGPKSVIAVNCLKKRFDLIQPYLAADIEHGITA